MTQWRITLVYDGKNEIDCVNENECLNLMNKYIFCLGYSLIRIHPPDNETWNYIIG